MQAKVEERLQQALLSDAPSNELIDVVVRFDLVQPAPAAGGAALAQQRERRAEATSQQIEAALARASEASGEAPQQVSMFPLLGSVFLQAHRPYLRALIDQAEVLGATLNTPDKR